MNKEEVEYVGRAISKGAAIVEQYRDGVLPATLDPEDLLASIENDAEFDEVCSSWIKESNNELERRQAIVSAAIANRRR